MLRNLTGKLLSKYPYEQISIRAFALAAQAEPRHHSGLEVMLPKHREPVKQLLMKTYTYDEPLNAAMQVQEDEIEKFIDRMIEHGLKSYASVVAIDHDTNILSGVQISVIHDIGHLTAPNLYMGTNEYSWNVQRILEFIDRLVQSSKTDHLKDAHRALQLVVATVEKNHRRMGLGRDVAQRSIDEAVYMDCDYVFSASTSYKSSLFLEKLGFKTVKTLPYDSFIDSMTGRRLFNVPFMDETSAKLMIRKLQDWKVEVPNPYFLKFPGAATAMSTTHL